MADGRSWGSHEDDFLHTRPPSPVAATRSVEATISDDRTCDSAFERTGQQWMALKRPTEGNKPPAAPGWDFTIEADTKERRALKNKRERIEALWSSPRSWLMPQRMQPGVSRAQTSHQVTPKRGTASAQWEDEVYGYDNGPGDVSQSQFEETRDFDQDTSSYRALDGRAYSLKPGYNDAEWQDAIPQQSIGAMAKLLRIPDEAATDLDTMRAYISRANENERPPEIALEPKGLIIHCVYDSKRVESDEEPYENYGYYARRMPKVSEVRRIYLDQPRWRSGTKKQNEILIGDIPVDDLDGYISRHPEVIFMVMKHYNASLRGSSRNADCDIVFKADHITESIIPTRRPLVEAIADFEAHLRPQLDRIWKTYGNSSDGMIAGYHVDEHHSGLDWDGDDRVVENGPSVADGGRNLEAPYLSIYHARGRILDTFIETLRGEKRSHFRLMLDHVFSSFEQEYATVDTLIARGRIRNAYMAYLFRPGVIVVSGQGDEARGYMCTSGVNAGGKHAEREKEDPIGNKPYILVWNLMFRDGFQRTKTEKIPIDFAPGSKERLEKSIDSLKLRPLAFASEEICRKLQNRGQWFWKCRKRQMVSYRSNSGERSHYATDRRYMIDMQVYRELHGDGARTARPLWMDDEEPPDENFVYLAPLKVQGYNLKTKKWEDLNVDGFSEVVWNTSAFDSLVLNGKTKRLIQALISTQIEADKSTDIISGKGNGLIMLLHGGPGTGKTLTAESVAEIAKRPLYPVTCGDIGTEPAAVERYLESVLHLGKTWGCVVLLDEADVFLEQRSLEDLHRNALVSVFLRVLEYYDGILVLTSNRVGTFDEAFKSRIQLAIHYTSLTTHQRTKIWENFFTRLETLDEEGIDFLDLKDHVEKLAEHKMNGREIRNVITTARQFARWERKQPGGDRYRLDYKMMEEVIETSGKFDKYIAKLNGGFTQDQLAEDEGLRLASTAE